MATGTLMPMPRFTGLDTNGNPVSLGQLSSFVAGTSTPATTYSDVGLTVANANPIILDTAGRPASGGNEFGIYLTPGASYKFVLKDASLATIWTQDNVAAVPSSSGVVELTGTAGEALTAGQAVYLSDGSGSKTPGSWYKADFALGYSSALPVVGIAMATIASGSSGTIRLDGQVTGLSSLTPGSDYYVGSAGALTTVIGARYLGRADSTTTLVLETNPRPVADTWANEFRLTLSTGVPMTTADVTAATTIFLSPFTGNHIDLPSADQTPVRFTSAELSIAVPATTSTVYDVFCFNSSGTPTLELVAWTNDTTRATGISRVNGTYVKGSDGTRRYVGSCRTTAVSGQTEDSAAKRYLFNYYNRASRLLEKTVAGNTTWNYTTATVRQANASTANQVEAVIGVVEVLVDITLQTVVANTGNANVQIGVGVDSTTTFASPGGTLSTKVANQVELIVCRYQAYPAVGRHVYSWNEWSQAAGTTSWNNASNSSNNAAGGLSGSYLG